MTDNTKKLFQWTEENSGGIMQLREDSTGVGVGNARESLFVHWLGTGVRRWLSLLGLAALATFFQYLAVKSIFAASSRAPEATALVAMRQVKAGRAMSVTDFSLQKVSSDRCFSEMVSDPSLLSGRAAANDIAEGKVIYRSDTQPLETRRSILSGIPQGKRLFQVSISEKSMSLALRRGDRVDVVGNLNLPGKGFVTRNLLANASVAGVERDGSAHNVFFFVTPTDVEFLTHAQQYGQLGMVLRNPNDFGENNTDGMTQSRFLDDARIRDVYETDLFQIRKG